MTYEDFVEKEEKELDVYWNEHDGTHFYKDELKSYILAREKRYKAYLLGEVGEMIKEKKKDQPGEWAYNTLTKLESELQKLKEEK